jgi:chitin synthase
MEEQKAEEEKMKRKDNRKGILGLLGITSIIHEIVELFRQARTLTLPNPETPSRTDSLLEELLVELRDNRLRGCENKDAASSSSESGVWRVKTSFQNNSQNAVEYASCKRTGELNNQRENSDQEWIKHHVFGDGPFKRLDEKEDLFWKQLLQKYLYPVKEDKMHQEKVANALRNLRNNVVFGFFMTSALWIALTMQLQLLQDEFKDTILFIKIPHIYASAEMTFEPLGMIFLGLFSLILLFQFIGMLSHRWGTILHVLSITDISCSQKFTERYKIQEIIAKAMELQRVSNIENEPEPDYDDPIPDYEDDDLDDDDDETVSTMFSSAGTSSTAAGDNLLSEQHDCPPKKQSLRRRNSAVFSRRGLTTARTLRRAFERRYRNQLQRERGGDEQSDSDINIDF